MRTISYVQDHLHVVCKCFCTIQERYVMLPIVKFFNRFFEFKKPTLPSFEQIREDELEEFTENLIRHDVDVGVPSRIHDTRRRQRVEEILSLGLKLSVEEKAFFLNMKE